MKQYLFFDVNGIQTFVFKVPKLKYIIGGSAIIDQFDKETIPAIKVKGTEYIFSGGGKGAFFCDDEAALQTLKKVIIEHAHNIGLDISFGQHADLSEATQHADEHYCFIPEMHSGYPCPETGLYPVKKGEACHEIIGKRLLYKGDKSYRRFESVLLPDVVIPGRSNDDFEFFHNIDSNESEGGKTGAKALGNRNRWAVISMDGNDMGMQFRYQASMDNPNRLHDTALQDWIKNMSRALDDCARAAASAGIQSVVAEWAGTEDVKKDIIKWEKIILPIRPLIVGGDDIVVLCHSSYAMTFVKEAVRCWEEISRKTPELWPATNGSLSISAGILFCPVTLPLHTAIPYSEMLLASAKTRGRDYSREKEIKGAASPACIDWEQITDTVIDTPTAKKQREYIFKDVELNRIIKLTQRPCTIEEYHRVENVVKKYRKVPGTIRHKIFPALTKGYADRLGFYAEVKKHHAETIFEDLNEFDERKIGKGWTLATDKSEQSTNIIDALMLLEEEARMKKETNQ